MSDILFETGKAVFSYRVAGICIQNGSVLLQRAAEAGGYAYAFPGGHVAFGETNAQTLIREFKEEMGADISVERLQWVGEIFFPWGEKSCHQICLYYIVQLKDASAVPEEGTALRERGSTVTFHWVPLSAVRSIRLYPTNTVQLLDKLTDGVQHFIYYEPAHGTK